MTMSHLKVLLTIANRPIIYDLKNMLDKEQVGQDYTYVPTGKGLKNDTI